MDVSSIEIACQRTKENWERMDQNLVENYRQGVNAPMFFLVLRPKVNYEMLDQEMLRPGGGDATAGGPSITRPQSFDTVAVGSGIERILGEERKQLIPKFVKRSKAVFERSSMSVSVTFERSVMPQGGITVAPQTLDPMPTAPLVCLGSWRNDVLLAQFDESWWYGAVEPRKLTWEAQANHWRGRRNEQVKQWQRDSRDQIALWKEMLGAQFAFRGGSIVYNPPQGASAGGMRPEHIAYLPTCAGVQLREPIVWQRLALKGSGAAPQPLDRLQPTVAIEGDRYVVTYKDLKTGKDKTLILRTRSGRSAKKR